MNIHDNSQLPLFHGCCDKQNDSRILHTFTLAHNKKSLEGTWELLQLSPGVIIYIRIIIIIRRWRCFLSLLLRNEAIEW
jgi:hypothetical protein